MSTTKIENTIFIDQRGALYVEITVVVGTDNISHECNGYEADTESSSPSTPTAHSEDSGIEDDMMVSGPLSLCETPVNHVQFLTGYGYPVGTPVQGATSPSEEFSNHSPVYGVGVDPNALTEALNNLANVQCRGRPENHTSSSRFRGSSSHSRRRR